MDALTQTFSALADPTRRAIIARLAAGEATVGEIAKRFEISGPAISRHLGALAGLFAAPRAAGGRPSLDRRDARVLDEGIRPARGAARSAN
jgi:DNA-binding transcriptional ArsR family regulator